MSKAKPTPAASSPPKEYFQVFAVINEHFPEEFNLDDGLIRDLVRLIDNARAERISIVMPSKQECAKWAHEYDRGRLGAGDIKYMPTWDEAIEWLRSRIESRPVALLENHSSSEHNEGTTK